MRFFPLLAAVAVSALIYMLILERPLLMETLGVSSSEAAQPAPDPTEIASEPTVEPTKSNLVKVVVRRLQAQDIDSGVVLRGQTAAARQVDVRAETSAIVASDPLRKGARVTRGDAMCVLDPGTRGAALQEAKARLSESESRVPEAEARVQEAQAKLAEAKINQNAAARLIEDGFASQTRVASTDAAVATARAGVSSAIFTHIINII